MANKHRNIDPEELMQKALEYCDECISNTKEVVAQYKTVEVRDRHLPTIGYFVSHWLRRQHFEFYSREHWYVVMKDEEHPLNYTIKRIDKMFRDLSMDIVANEGKGIFYAKNFLNMGDNGLKDGSTEDRNITINLIEHKNKEDVKETD